MNAIEIEEDRLGPYAQPFDPDCFPYRFLEAFGNKPRRPSVVSAPTDGVALEDHANINLSWQGGRGRRPRPRWQPGREPGDDPAPRRISSLRSTATRRPRRPLGNGVHERRKPGLGAGSGGGPPFGVAVKMPHHSNGTDTHLPQDSAEKLRKPKPQRSHGNLTIPRSVTSRRPLQLGHFRPGAASVAVTPRWVLTRCRFCRTHYPRVVRCADDLRLLPLPKGPKNKGTLGFSSRRHGTMTTQHALDGKRSMRQRPAILVRAVAQFLLRLRWQPEIRRAKRLFALGVPQEVLVGATPRMASAPPLNPREVYLGSRFKGASASMSIQAVRAHALLTAGEREQPPRRGPARVSLRIGTFALAASFTLLLTTLPAHALQLGPALVLEDSVILRETARHYVGEPTALLVAEDGSFFISDRFSNNIVRFDSAGEFLGAFGRAGEGPGEFTYIGTAGFIADGVLGFLDLRPFSLEMFEVATGSYRGRVAIEDGTFPMSFSARNDTLWFAGMQTESWSAAGMATVSDVIAESVDLSLDRVPVARPYVENRMIFGTLAFTALDVGDEDLMVGFGVSPFVLRTNREGAVLDSLVFPVSRRRGLPDEDELTEIGMDDVSVPELIGRLSTLWAVSRDDHGYVYAIHQDFEYGDPRRGGGFDARASFFVSSIRQDGSRACPDTSLPTSGVGVAKAALRGNRIHVLDQRLGDGVQTAQAVIRRFRINPSDCTGRITRLDGRS